jgi:hypothetical protein
MSIITVKDSDITVIVNGHGIIMRYFGNCSWHDVECEDLRTIGKTQAEAVSDFVAYLNNIPIVG